MIPSISSEYFALKHPVYQTLANNDNYNKNI